MAEFVMLSGRRLEDVPGGSFIFMKMHRDQYIPLFKEFFALNESATEPVVLKTYSHDVVAAFAWAAEEWGEGKPDFKARYARVEWREGRAGYKEVHYYLEDIVCAVEHNIEYM
jgi:hypothetical protein